MISLAIVRHAKSDWGDPGVPDHDRPLNARGLRDAPRMAARLAERGFRPDRILTSTALRAATTADAFGTALGLPAEREPLLYGADADTLRQVAVESGAPSVLLVAHDPGLSILAYELSGEIPHMPTCAVATFTWDVDDWDAASRTDPQGWDLDVPR